MIFYLLEQYWLDTKKWEKDESETKYSSLSKITKHLKQIKDWDKFEGREIKYRIIRVSEKVVIFGKPFKK